MGIEVIVWDFDGTVTKVDEECIPFVAGYKDDFAKSLGIPIRVLSQFWNIKQKEVRDNPTQHGWTVNRKIVAPAYADPMVECRTIADLLLLEHSEYMNDAKKRDEKLFGLYRKNYPNCLTVFKEDAAEAFIASQAFAPTYVVTNSNTDAVQEKIGKLAIDISGVKVVGNAKKYALDDAWQDVPESVTFEGFGRPLYLRRKFYADILFQIMEQRNVTPEKVLVAGDIYELDLLLPQQLGMHVALLPRDRTPLYERNAVSSYSSGVVLASPADVVQYAKSVR